MRKNLIGQKFHNLTVISQAASIISGNIPRSHNTWNCRCDCGNMIVAKTTHLTRGNTKSCGCLFYGIKCKPGEKFARLTTISYQNGRWLCVCQCGKYSNVKTNQLTSGKTKSCGCLSRDKAADKFRTNIKRTYEPRIASARRIWKSYCYNDKNCNLNFEEFFEISQRNCFYCDGTPNNKYNNFIYDHPSSQKAKNEGDFFYNGLDRIDNSKFHTLDNIVPCCYICNRAKTNRSVEDFYSWISKLKMQDFQPLSILEIDLPEIKHLKTSIKNIFYIYKKDTNLTISEYYSISQMNCFYCESPPSNKFNKLKHISSDDPIYGTFIYSGIDRVDSDRNHAKDNLVPCCKYCNFAKSDLSLNEFQEWIKRIKTNYNSINKLSNDK